MNKYNAPVALGLTYDGKPMANVLKSKEAMKTLNKYGIHVVESEDDEMGAYLAMVPDSLSLIIEDGGSFQIQIPYDESYIEIICESP